MKLTKTAISWALKHLQKYSDSDLFPKPLEVEILFEKKKEVIDLLANTELPDFSPGPSRRFIVPKDDLSTRAATQLDILDSIILTAIVYKYGEKIERRRRPISEKRVFSYRFSPDSKGNLYNSQISWNQFWQEGLRRATQSQFVTILDISDFYNQIYHHIVENQLIDSGFPNQVKNWIKNLFSSLTVEVSRGIPIGPRAAHIIAEATLIPIDNSMVAKGINYCRFVDDILVFSNSASDAKRVVYQIASILDAQQRLSLQRQKTKILKQRDFINYCQEMIEDRPINDFEKQLVEIIQNHSNGDPYQTISMSDISNDELRFFNEDVVESILSEYLSKPDPDFIRIRWFIRRLTQVGHPSAINFCLSNFDRLIPAIADICHYFISASNSDSIEWSDIGEKILEITKHEIVESNEYFQISLFSLFNKIAELNHVDKLISIYTKSPPCIRREIFLAAFTNDLPDIIREHKEQFVQMEPWVRRAFIIACKNLPSEEKKFFLKHIKANSLLEDFVIKWSKT